MKRFYMGLIPLVFSIVAAWPSLNFEFSGDDFILIVHNEDVKSVDHVLTLFKKDFFSRKIVDLPVEGSIGYYRPITKISFLFDWLLFKRNAKGFHLTNILLHAVVALMLFKLLLSFGLSQNVALLGSLLFCVYPSHAQAVGLINARSDLLCALGYVLAMIALWYGSTWGVVLASFLAIFSKETGVGVVLLIAGMGFLKYRSLKLILRNTLPILMVLMIYFFLRQNALDDSVQNQQPFSWYRFLYSTNIIGSHMYALSNMSIDWIYPLLFKNTLFFFVITFMTVPVLLYLIVVNLKNKNLKSIFYLLVFCGFLPFFLSHRIHVPNMGLYTPIHLRWSYIPALGVCALVGIMMVRAFDVLRWKVSWLWLAAPIFLLMYWQNLMPYKNDHTMLIQEYEQYMMVQYEDLPLPLRAKRLGLQAIELAKQKRYDEAHDMLLEALKMDSGNPFHMSNLGLMCYEQKKYACSIEWMKKSLTPIQKNLNTFVVDDHHLRDRPYRYFILAKSYLFTNHVKEAKHAILKSIEADPLMHEYHFVLANVLATEQKLSEAFDAFKKVLELKPCDSLSLMSLRKLSQLMQEKAFVLEQEKLMNACKAYKA